ncbi:MAG: hypothetical protein HY038_08355 [Nitrospirae bacterium]|nr:hypothetical protein [Nitrospirota bacterium]
MAMATAFPTKDLKGESLTEFKLRTSATRCARCEGLLVIEQCFDVMGDAGRPDFLARRCVQCGEVIDPVILQNRRRQFGNTLGPDQRSK